MAANKIIIIGAGPCGLGAAYALEAQGCHDWLLLESAPHPGGLSASFRDDKGFTWDVGGHVVFSHYELFTQILSDATKHLEHRRDASIYMLNRFVPYPFQYNIRHLPEKMRDECIAGLRAAENISASKPANFGEWLAAGFGAGIDKIFMRPYNQKVWGHPLEDMDWRWIGDRVARPDLARIIKNIETGADDVSWGPNSTFRFPLEGGTGAIWRAIAEKLPQKNIRYRTAVSGVDPAKKTVIANGENIPYSHLISTMPLDELAVMCGMKTPVLTSNSGIVVGLGLAGAPPENLKKRCWIYFPENNFPFYRATVFSNYSPKNVPDGKNWSLMVEVTLPTAGNTHSPEISAAEIERLAEKAELAARNAGLITPDNTTVSRWTYPIKRSYPIPTVARNRELDAIQPKLLAAGIYSRGRFGAWKYEVGNMDHSFMQGVEAARNILLGEEEITVNKPEVVNKK